MWKVVSVFDLSKLSHIRSVSDLVLKTDTSVFDVASKIESSWDLGYFKPALESYLPVCAQSAGNKHLSYLWDSTSNAVSRMDVFLFDFSSGGPLLDTRTSSERGWLFAFSATTAGFLWFEQCFINLSNSWRLCSSVWKKQVHSLLWWLQCAGILSFFWPISCGVCRVCTVVDGSWCRCWFIWTLTNWHWTKVSRFYSALGS